MSQIPVFLRALSALVRQRVASGHAVHVTADTAQELELLAGLEWGNAYWIDECSENRGETCQRGADCEGDQTRMVAPSDIAMGWLLASKAVISDIPYDSLAGEGVYVVAYESDADRASVCAELVVMAAQILPQYEGDTPGIIWPEGTRAGAQAAWYFVVLNLPQLKQHFDLRETYRRELDAMR